MKEMSDKKKMRTYSILSAVLFLAFLTLIVFLKTIDVGHVAFLNAEGGKPVSVEVGFSSFNESVAKKLTFSKVWYDLSEIFGIICLLAAGGFALLGIVQIITRKSLKSVDKKLYLLGAFFVLVIVFYVFFEMVVVNYRPAHNSSEGEASFPSSHTVLSICVCFATATILPDYVKSKKLSICMRVALGAVAAFTVIARTLSGVHWATDIIGGILLSFSLCFLFKAATVFLSVAEKEKVDG